MEKIRLQPVFGVDRMKKIYDIVGVGFGPSNLALAAAISETKQSNLTALFLEKEPIFTWHKNMLLDNADMQISFLKDIATLRNPSSPYTFLNYLHEQGRLSSFINLKSFYPSRIEFNDYFLWVANKLKRYVQYNSYVVDIIPYGNKPFRLLKVIIDNPQTGRLSIITKNVVIATGGSPIIPNFVTRAPNSQRIWHTADYLANIAKFKNNTACPYHFSVIGRGQSAAEIAYDLHTNFPNATITCVHRHFGYKSVDESQFSNEIFDTAAVDLFYSAPAELRNKFLNAYQDTNYSVVDSELLEKLYKIKYEESVLKKERLKYMGFSSIARILEKEHKVEIAVESLLHTDVVETLSVDAAILATGYQFQNPSVLLSSMADYFIYCDAGLPEINRHYRLSTTSQLLAGIYTQGCNERTHGLTDTLLSIGALRAQEILQQIESSNDANAVTTLKTTSVSGYARGAIAENGLY